MDFGTVRAIATALPDVNDASGPRGLAFKVHGKLLACTAIHSSAEANSLAVCIDPQLRAELLESEPKVYYVTPHYVSYPMVLVRLERVGRAALKKLLGTALLFVASRPAARPRTGKPAAAQRRAARAQKSRRS